MGSFYNGKYMGTYQKPISRNKKRFNFLFLRFLPRNFDVYEFYWTFYHMSYDRTGYLLIFRDFIILFHLALEFAATGGTVFVADPSVWDELWPKLVVFLPVIIYIILCAIDSLKDYQLKVASALSAIFSFLMLYVLVAVIVQGKLKKGP